MEDLTVAIIQSPIQWQKKSENLTLFSDKITAIKEDVGLIVLPEMFTTGFSMESNKLAETVTDQTVDWMLNHAKQMNSVITGSFICEEDWAYYNRLIWAKPNGTFLHYDKKHLFRMANEHEHFNSGSKKMIIDLNGWRVCPLICYDLRFPVWSRNTSADNYDLLIYVANWPEKRRTAWSRLLSARAIENQSYVVGVNRIGNDGNGISYSGDSVVLDFNGEVMSSTKPCQDNVEIVNINYSTLEAFRNSFPVLKDADSFNLMG